MSQKYNNYKKFLEENNYILITSLEEFLDKQNNGNIEYKCIEGHNTIIKHTSFGNKKSNIEPKFLCTDCKLNNDREVEYDKVKKELFKTSGHKLKEYTDKKNISYNCGNCDNLVEHTTFSNAIKNKKCKSCFNKENKNTYEHVMKILEQHEITLRWSNEKEFNKNYTDNKQLLPLICRCGSEFEMKLSDIKRGRCCGNCKKDRTNSTNIEKYGAENVFASDIIKEKIKETNLQRHGVEYPQQNKEINKKTQETCKEKYGVSFAFTQDWVFQKIRDTHFKNYGVNFPLQSKDIQQKISNIFLEKYGVTRPLLSEIYKESFKKLMLEKYGNEFFLHSNVGKQMMLDKYGSEYYVCSPHFKEYFQKKYGVNHPLQVPEIFHKVMKSQFTRKKYTFPNGREVMLLGYENRAIDHILDNRDNILKRRINEDEIIVDDTIPVIDYIDDDGKKRKYYPDIYIKDTELIIEVKSVYTFNLEPRKNYLKFKAANNAGYNLKMMMFDKKQIVDIHYYLKNGKCYSHRDKTLKLDEPYPYDSKDILNIGEDDIDDFNLELLQKELEIISEENN